MNKEIQDKAIKAFQAHRKVFSDYLSELEKDSLKETILNKDARDESIGKVKLVWFLQKLISV